MKITITIDTTPEEFRQAMGLPVLNNIHKALLDKMSDQVRNGAVDVEKIFEVLGPSMKAGQEMIETLFKGMGNAAMNIDPNGSGSSSKKDSKK